MRKIILKIFLFFLSFPAKRVIQRSDLIIGITGTVGKTSVRMAIAHILASKKSVRTSSQNFNTPLGILLSLLNITAVPQSMWQWMLIFFQIYFGKKEFPEILVLEYGVDAPGNMDELLTICIPDIAILTPIALGHTNEGQFSSVEDIRKEKLKLADAAKKMVIGNGFDVETKMEIEKRKLKKEIFFIQEKNLTNAQTTEKGITFEFLGVVNHLYKKYTVPVFGSFQSQIFAPAILLAQKENISEKHIQSSLNNFSSPAGRGRIFAGKNGETLWDFSYNSSRKATEAVLNSLQEIQGFERKIAILGNMNELGKFSEVEHEKLGKITVNCADEIYFVGNNQNNFEAFQRGVGQKITCFRNAKEATEKLKREFQKGDIILCKGSQADVYLEYFVEKFLKNTEDIQKLCRRGDMWEKKRKESFLKYTKNTIYTKSSLK